jgi:ribosome biogenesis GTPase
MAETGSRDWARVVIDHGRHLLIEAPAGTRLQAQTRRLPSPPVTGDRVYFQDLGGGQARIEAVLPRRTTFRRLEGRRHNRVVAANVDQLLIVFAPLPVPEPELLDRYLIAAHVLALRPLLLMNKSDLPADQCAAAQRILSDYAAIGYPGLQISTRSGLGLAELTQRLQGLASLLVGQSGVGKSALTNALIPGALNRVGELSEALGTGRHTTTATRWHALASGGALLDAPGVRDFKLWPLSPRELMRGFPEFAGLAPCRFVDCLHQREPGCAILAALDEGRVSGRRHGHYLRLLAQMQRTPAWQRPD